LRWWYGPCTLPPASSTSNVAVDGVQVLDGFHAGDTQGSVHRADMLDVRAMRDVDSVFHGDFHAFVLWIARRNGNGIRFRFDVDGDPFQSDSFTFAVLSA